MKTRQTFLFALSALLIACTSSVGFSQAVDGPNSIGSGNSQVSPLAVSGRVKLIHELEVAAQADGLIRNIYAEEGQTVTEGATMIRIDNRMALADVAVAEKELEAAQEQAKQTADIEYATASYAVAKAEHGRVLKLIAKNAASVSEKMRAELEEERSRLAIQAAEVKHNQELLAAIVAEEKLNATRVKLELYDVLAPMEGLITERIRDQGEWARAGEPILKMVHMNQMKVTALVDTEGLSVSNLLGARMEIFVRVNRPDEEFIKFEAKVDYVSPIIDARQVEVWTRVQNQRVSVGGPWGVRDGMDADVRIYMNQ